MTIYMVCATRTNLVYVIIFAALIPVFALLSAAYWRLGVGDKVGGERLIVVRPAIAVSASLLKPVGHLTQACLGLRGLSFLREYIRLLPPYRAAAGLCWLSSALAYW